jgi:hypothetical protein
MTLELKGKLLDMEQRAGVYKTKVAAFLNAVEPFVARLKMQNEGDELVGLFLQEIEKLGMSEETSTGTVENPIQRQARLESLTSAIREQFHTVTVLSASNASASGAPVWSADFQGGHTPLILAHFVLEKLDNVSLASIAATCKHWHRRALQYLSTRVKKQKGENKDRF